MKQQWKRKLISIVTFVAGAYFFLEWLLPEELGKQTIARYHSEVLHSLQIVGIMSIGLGVINLLQVYGRTLIRKRPGWFNSLVLLLGFFATMYFGLHEIVESERSLTVRKGLDAAGDFARQIAEKPELQQRNKVGSLLVFLGDHFGSSDDLSSFRFASPLDSEERAAIVAAAAPVQGSLVQISELHQSMRSDESGDESSDKALLNESLLRLQNEIKLFTPVLQQVAETSQRRSQSSRIGSLLQQGLWVPLASAMFALLAFYIASAAYRAFRIRSAETACIMAAALIVILGQIPHGPLYISESLPAVRLWILEYINAPAFRAIYIGSTVAGLAMAIRIWFSIERSLMDVGGSK